MYSSGTFGESPEILTIWKMLIIFCKISVGLPSPRNKLGHHGLILRLRADATPFIASIQEVPLGLEAFFCRFEGGVEGTLYC